MNCYSTIHILELIYFDSNTVTRNGIKVIETVDIVQLSTIALYKISHQIFGCNWGINTYLLPLLCAKIMLHCLTVLDGIVDITNDIEMAQSYVMLISIVKLGREGVNLFFLFLLQNIDCGYSLEPLCLSLWFEQKNKKNMKNFQLKFLNFLS